MSYVKNYNPGQIRMDLPTANYIHELPLLSFSDIHGAVNLSLIFNYGMRAENSNPFNITEGYKLNLQKRLILENGVPTAVQDESGKCISLIGDSFPYTFDDDSRRILRQNNDAAKPYVIENPDFSTEEYYSDGMIAIVADKYNTEILKYEYNLDDDTDKITYRGAKTITLFYNSLGLATIAFSGCSDQIAFTHTSTGIVVTQLDGSVCTLASDSMNFSALAAATRTSTAVYATTLETSTTNSTVLIVSDIIGAETVNSVSYKFPSVPSYNTEFTQVEITDHLGVQTRAQYRAGKLLYSYELTNGEAAFDNLKYLGNVQIYNTVDDMDNGQAVGVQTINDGIALTCVDTAAQRYEYDASSHALAGAKGYFLLTGWIKAADSTTAFGDTKLYATHATGLNEVEFYPVVPIDTQWRFFAYKLHMDANFIAVYPDVSSKVTLKDLRITFQATHVWKADDTSHVAISEDVLIHPSGDSFTYIPLREATFTYGSLSLAGNGTVYFEDLLKYKTNQIKNSNTGEFYCNKGKNICTYNPSTPIMVADAEGNGVELNNCYLGKRQYTASGMVTMRIRENTTNGLIYEVFDASGFLISSQVLDNNLDTILSADANITTKYERNNDLVKSETVSKTVDLSDPEYEPDTPAAPLFTRTTNYDDYPDGVIVTDEFGNETKYTFDSTWGVVKSVTLPDATVVTDFYDSDMCAKLKRSFGSSAGRSISYDYAGGNLTSLQTGSLGYTFGYIEGDITSVSKNDVLIEEHAHTTTQTDSYYPSQISKLHSTSAVFDKYGRLTSIAGVLTNTYDLWPAFNTSTGALIPSVDNGSSLLAVTTDEIRSETAQFTYNGKGLLVGKTVTDKTDFTDKIREESFEYDNINRLTKHTATYDVANSKSVEGVISYKKSATHPFADNTVKTYTYKVNGNQKAYSVNSFDTCNRFYMKESTFTNNPFTKTLTYSDTRVSDHADTLLGNNLGTNNYTYDSLGRIEADSYSSQYSASDYKTYEYDQYGQLTRENNQGLDKTYVYEYNDIGNLTSVKAYDYTLSTTPSGTPVTTTFGYTDDRLTSFGGSTIAYNTMGCPARYDDKFVVWSKGKLSRFTSGNFTNGTSSYGYEYNAFGQRVSKDYSYTEGTSGLNPVQTGQVTAYTKNYHYDHAGRLIAESSTKTLHGQGTSNESIVFLYDESGIIGMELTTGGVASTYYFQRNLQGDVVAIYDTNGTLKAKYLYDAWGNCTISSDTTNTAVANANPIRYRGYYYDSDTGLYYCNARYYSPKWHRFISPDDTAYLDPENVNGLNSYIYANNNPISVGHKVQKQNDLQKVTYNPSACIPTPRTSKIAKSDPFSFSVGVVTPKLASMPSWLQVYGFYVKGSFGWGYTFGEGYSLASFSIGVLDATFHMPKLWGFLPNDHLANPNIFLGVGTWNVNISLGIGISGTAEILSGTIGAQFGDSVNFALKGYVGIGFTLDFTNGLRIGAGLGVGIEVFLAVDWYELFN